VIARLGSGVSISRAQAELDGISLRLAEQYPQAKDQRARLDPLKEDIVGSSSRALEIMLGAVGLVLILVCVNIANLMLVRGSERAREFAVRSALGAGRTRLLRQLLIESLTLAVAGALAGLMVARLAMSAIVILGSGTIPRLAGLTLDPRLLAFSLALAVGSAVLFGLTPAVHAARTDPGEALAEQSRGSTSGGRSVRTREGLVVSQVALALVLLVGAGLLLASIRALGLVELGIRPANVLTFELHLPEARYDSIARGQFYEAFATQVMSLPGVRAAGGTSKLPATGPYHQWGTMALSGPFAGDDQKRFIGAQNRVVSGDYFAAVEVPVLEGRVFDERDRPGMPDRVVINEYLADRLFPGVRAVGQTLRSGGRNNEVIGVVGNVAITNEGGEDAFVYHAHGQFAGDRPWALTQVVSFTGSARPLEQAIRRVLVNADPRLVMYHPMLLDAAIGRGAAQRRFMLRILITFAAVALAISAVGIFGLLSYGVKLRSREIGIRMALGAERRTIGTMVLRRGLAITGIGVGIGLAGAIALSSVMSAVLFRVSPVDPVVLAGSVAFMGLVAAVAAWLPARRATGVEVRRVLG
jgi:predicted permease